MTLEPENYRTTIELGYDPLVIYGDFDREGYRIHSCRQLEIIEVMPNPQRLIDETVLMQLICEELGATIKYEHCVLEKQRAWGYVKFQRYQAPIVVLDARLEDPRGYLVTIKKTTLAHELGHLYLHKDAIEQEALFRTAAFRGDLVAYVSRTDILPVYSVEPEHRDVLSYIKPLPYHRLKNWDNYRMREFQANQYMVGLLMPFINLRRFIANFFRLRLSQIREQNGWTPLYSLMARKEVLLSDCIYAVAGHFGVSKQMAAIEIGRLWDSRADSRLFFGALVLPQRVRG